MEHPTPGIKSQIGDQQNFHELQPQHLPRQRRKRQRRQLPRCDRRHDDCNEATTNDDALEQGIRYAWAKLASGWKITNVSSRGLRSKASAG